MSFEKGKAKTGGRAPGVQNKATRDIRAIAQGLIEDSAYQASLKRRLLKGSSPQLEVLLHYYAYGKPKMEIQADNTLRVVIEPAPPVTPLPANRQRLVEINPTDIDCQGT
jgi:hypothetical protein